jgi:hypothetical protein
MGDSSNKFDCYEVLGLKKDDRPSEDQISLAFKKIAMVNHPDAIKRKPGWTQADLDKADTKFKQATEARDVLCDKSKRAAYDQFGWRGVENLQEGKSAASGQSFEEVAGPTQKRTYDTEATMDFFTKIHERKGGTTAEPDVGIPDNGPALSREEARKARMNRARAGAEARSDATSREAPSILEIKTPPPTTTKPPVTPPRPPAQVKDPVREPGPSEDFGDVSGKISKATDALRDGVTLPLDVLTDFRQNLADFLGEVDKAITRAKSGPPKPAR